jgi:hypothetical protein
MDALTLYFEALSINSGTSIITNSQSYNEPDHLNASLLKE